MPQASYQAGNAPIPDRPGGSVVCFVKRTHETAFYVKLCFYASMCLIFKIPRFSLPFLKN